MTSDARRRSSATSPQSSSAVSRCGRAATSSRLSCPRPERGGAAAGAVEPAARPRRRARGRPGRRPARARCGCVSSTSAPDQRGRLREDAGEGRRGSVARARTSGAPANLRCWGAPSEKWAADGRVVRQPRDHLRAERLADLGRAVGLALVRRRRARSGRGAGAGRGRARRAPAAATRAAITARRLEPSSTAVSALRSSSAGGSPSGPSRPASTSTSRSTSPSRSKVSARSSQTPAKCAALPGRVKPGRNSRRSPSPSVRVRHWSTTASRRLRRSRCASATRSRPLPPVDRPAR